MNKPTEHPEDLVTLVVKSTEFEANTTVAILEDAGIKAFAFSAMRAALPLNERMTGVPVQVRRMDFERAERALQQNIADSVDLDWDSVDVGDREDDLPLTSRKGMPPLMKAGFATAVVAVVVMIVAALVYVGEVVL